MNLEEIKQGIASLSPQAQNEVTAFLFHLRHAGDAGYQQRVTARLADSDQAHWVTPENFERRLDQR